MSEMGKKIKELRKDRGLTLQVLGKKASITATYISAIERGDRRPSMNTLELIAGALGTSVSYLIGEAPYLPLGARSFSLDDTWPVPVLSPAAVACAGSGNGGMDGIILEAEEFIIMPRDWLGTISVDRDKQPFAIKVEGDSMEEAGIPDRVEVVINPIAEVFNGDVVLACFGRKNELAVKWVYYHPDGKVELRAASPHYPAMIFSKEEQEDQHLRILGKVVRTSGKPKRGT